MSACLQAHFLRTCYPDVDIQAELIRDQIMEDARATQEIMREDPYSGNLIDVSSFHVARKNLAYLAFPMGETNCQLSKSQPCGHPSQRSPACSLRHVPVGRTLQDNHRCQAHRDASIYV